MVVSRHCRWLSLLWLASVAAAARPVLQAGLAGIQSQGRRQEDLNDRPLIGIVSQTGDPAPDNHTYIAASYVKFVEAAGARVVPIQCDLPEAEVRERFKAINGVLIPGGGQTLEPGHPFYDTTKLLLDLAVEANEDGDYFPVHGTCLGLETLAIIAARNTSLLSEFDAEDNASPLLLTKDADDSYFFTQLPKHIVKALVDKPLAMENHAAGVSYRAYDENPHLRDFFKVLSLSVDRNGGVYISTFESRKYPITATQWHPEKNAFEWAPQLHIPHSSEAVDVSMAVAKFVVDEARNNQHAPANQEDEERMLIYNVCPKFTARGGAGKPGEEADFMQVYIFPMGKDGADTLAAYNARHAVAGQ